MTTKSQYGAESITVLEGLEGVRKRPRDVHRFYRQGWFASSCI
jgi:hypothetical protein